MMKRSAYFRACEPRDNEAVMWFSFMTAAAIFLAGLIAAFSPA
jgi:hypothetical protein